jgi:predicted enzyme related to lactoylglutathione lyase
MAKVLGIGGVFIKTADKAALKDWYARVLGVEFTAWGGAMFENPKVGVQQITPFAMDSDKFSGPFMLNLIVEDLDGLAAQAEAAGVKVMELQDSEYGKFAWVMDPAGVKVELWEPPAES